LVFYQHVERGNLRSTRLREDICDYLRAELHELYAAARLRCASGKTGERSMSEGERSMFEGERSLFEGERSNSEGERGKNSGASATPAASPAKSEAHGTTHHANVTKPPAQAAFR
jgi:hypothetical protein